MSAIVIYTNPDTLEHKKGADGFDWYYWSMSRPPKKLEEGDKIFFAVEGAVVGSFVCDRFRPGDTEETVIWYKSSWQPLSKPIPTKAFRGFRYVWW